MIGRDSAQAVAERYLLAKYKPLIRTVRDGAEIRSHALYSPENDLQIERCWVVFLADDLTALRSSTVVIVSKASGDVVYHGPLGDEG